jgi:citrate lyase subunit beta/citryl-CoA lyase
MARDAAAARRPLYGPVLFTPADRPDRFDKGREAGHGALILDLEDGVGPATKAAARAAAHERLGRGNTALVRVNAVDTDAFGDDEAALASASDLAAIVIPKTQSASDLAKVAQAWPGAALFPLIESPEGLARLAEIASARGVVQLMLGALDMHAALGMRFPQADFISYCRIQLVLASQSAGLAPPVDSPFPGFKDLDEVARDARSAAGSGFAAKLCIHPAQLQPVRHAFMPTADELAWAREVDAAAGTGGAVSVRGAMVDAPVVKSARRLLERARQLEQA